MRKKCEYTLYSTEKRSISALFYAYIYTLNRNLYEQKLDKSLSIFHA